MAAPTQRGIGSPAQGSVAITPHDTTNIAYPIRYLTVSVAGTVAWVGMDGTAYATNSLPAGTYPLEALRIKATGTSATGLTGWY